MAINALDVTRSLIAYTVATDKGSLVRLLERNGVKMPANPSDSEVTASVLLASSKSPNFKNELAKILTAKAEPAGKEFKSFVGQEMGFTGLDDMAFTGWETFKNAPGNIVSPLNPLGTNPSATLAAGKKDKGKTGAGKVLAWLGKNVFTQENINAGVQIGLTSMGNKAQQKSNALQTETNTITAAADDIKNTAGKPTKKPLSTMAWVGIGAGVLALVGITIYLVKKK